MPLKVGAILCALFLFLWLIVSTRFPNVPLLARAPLLQSPVNLSLVCGGRGLPQLLEVDEASAASVAADVRRRGAGAPPSAIVLLVHGWESARVASVMRLWAVPRCLALVRPGGAPYPGPLILEIAVIFFEGSPALTKFDGWGGATVLHTPPAESSATQRTLLAFSEAAAAFTHALWFVKADDDNFLHVGRLARVLLARDADAPAMLGRVMGDWGPAFAAGGASYALSRAALQRVALHLQLCATGFNGLHEDVMMTRCFEKYAAPSPVEDLPGLNMHPPEQLLVRASFRDADARAVPISFHYIDPPRAALMMRPEAPRRLLQVWPFEAALPAAYSRPPGALDAFWARSRACEAAAEAAGFVYELVDLRTAELSAACYSGRLTPRARELFAGLNLLYLQGGVFVSLWEDCRRPGGRDLDLLASLLPPAVAADPAAAALPPILDSLKDVWQVGAPSHYFACISATSACAVATATQYSHGSFRLLAALTRALVGRDPSHFDNARFGEAPVAELWSRFAGALEDVGASARALSPASLRALTREYAVPLDDLTMVRGAGAVEAAVAPPPRPLLVAVYCMWGAEGDAAGVLAELRGILAPVLWLALGRPLEPVESMLSRPLDERLDTADVILFGPFGNRTRSGEVARRHAGQAITVFIGSENQWQGSYHDHMVPDVHVSLSFSRDVDAGNYLRLPWWLPYSLDAAIPLTDTPRFSSLLRRLPAEEDGEVWAARPRLASLLSRHYNFPRPELFSLLTGAGHAVDAPSVAFHNMEWPVGLANSLEGKIDFLRGYRFNVCPENSKTGGRGGYSTEKLAQALMAGTVPIYWGDPLDSEVFNPVRVILFNGTDGAPVLEAIRRLEEDAQFRQNWFASPILAAGADEWLSAWVTRAAGLFQLAAPVLRES